MELLAPAPEQALVGGIPHQRVLEGIVRVLQLAAAEDQLRLDQLTECVMQAVIRQTRDGGQQVLAELPPNYCRNLSHFLPAPADPIGP